MQAVAGHVIQSGVNFLGGVGLCAAGVLVLLGRSQYQAWRRAKKAWDAEKEGD